MRYTEDTLEAYAILRTIKEYPGYTAYQVQQVVSTLLFYNISFSQLYTRINSLRLQGYIERGILTHRGIMMHHGVLTSHDAGFSGYPLYLTVEGVKRLLELEFKMRIVLAFEINGKKVIYQSR